MELSRALSLLSEHPSSPGGRGRNAASNVEALLGSLDELLHISEVLQGEEQATFIHAFLPWTIKLMAGTPVKMNSGSIEHRTRQGVLAVLKTIAGIAEPVKPFLDDLMGLLLGVLREDNEENGIIAIHILIDLHKVHRTQLEAYAQPLVDYVLHAFESFSDICETVFETAKKEEKGTTGSSRRGSTRGTEGNLLLKATSSFKVLIECPVMVVLLFQIYRRLISENINKFAPQVIQTLSVAIPQPSFPSTHNTGGIDALNQVSPVHAAYADYISAQVKALSFLAYISRGFAAIIRPHYGLIPSNVIRLLRACPPDSASARKELLVATRHILSTEIRQAFVPFLGDLLDEGLLLGEGYTGFYVLRPLALSMLADLVHHVRAEIPLPVLIKIVHIYSQALHDPTLPIGVQTMSAKLLVNLVDSMLVEELGPQQERRSALLAVLFALLAKFDWMASFIQDLRGRKDAKLYSPFFDDPYSARPVDTDVIAMDPNRDNFRDFKFLLKTLIGGLKNVLFALKTLKPEASPQLFSIDEGRAFLDLFLNGIGSFELFRMADEPTKETKEQQHQSPTAVPDALLNVVAVHSEEKEIYEQFSYLFTILDAPLFQEVFSFHLESLVEATRSNHALLIIPQYFLAIAGISRNFAGLLLRYLMDNFDDLVSVDLTKGAISLRLFKLLFLAVSVYPDENESVLQPHLTEIIMNCLKRHQHTPRSLNYFLLLRSLFRSIGGGRFDALYKEVLPLLSVILEELGKLPTTTNDPLLRELYVELCLTTPVRLSVLLPYLSHLMKPLVLALQSSPELISQGLRTLELCIDNLTQDFLEPIVFPILDELLECLWSLLKPPPANQAHSHASMRILGKMGGRSHRYLPLPKPMPYNENVEDQKALGLIFKFAGSSQIELPLDQIILSATAVLQPTAKATSEQRSMAFDLVSTSVRALFEVQQVNETALPIPFQSQLMKNPQVSQELTQEVSSRLSALQLDASSSKPRSCISRALCESVIFSLFWASGNPDLAEQATLFLLDIYTVIASSLVRTDLNVVLLPPPDVFFDAIIDISCAAAEACETVITQAVVKVIERLHLVNQHCSPQDSVILSVLMEKLITACYRVKASEKIHVIRLINVTRNLDNLDLPWVWIYEVRLTRGVLYAMKCFTPGLVSLHGSEVTETLLKFLRLCNRHPSEDSSQEAPEKKARRVQFFNQLVTLLVSEVSNANSLVRSAVQSCFQLLADVTGSDVTELLLPLKDRLLAPIFTKPLRALPANLQIGYIDAITYCLSLRPPLMDVNDELLRLLNEAIALSEADDSFLVTKTNQIQNSASILQLRLVCIRLLSTALSTAEFQLPKLQPVRNMIVAVFFKALYSRSNEVVDASRIALEQVMVNQHKLPKDLLQTALRPVLTNLAEAKRLTLPGLEGLRRVLELLTSYFKAEIGKKLLDHLAAWSEPKKPLQDAASKPLCESMEVRVISSILDIFHLLPPSGHVFVSELVTVVIGLEHLIQRAASSPFRPPLQRLLTHYPEESVDYLLSKYQEPGVAEIFAFVLQMNASDPLVEALSMRSERLGQILLETSNDIIRLEIIKIIERVVLSDRLPVPTCIDLLESIWSSNGQKRSRTLALDAVKEARAIYRIISKYILMHPESLQLAFLAITILEFSFMSACDNSLPGILTSVVEKCISSGQSALVIKTWCMFHTAKDFKPAVKVQAIRMVLLPCLGYLRDTDSIDVDTVSELVGALSATQSKVPHDASMLAVEEIQVLTFLLPIVKSREIASQLYRLLLEKAQMSDPSVRFSVFCGLITFLRLGVMTAEESSEMLLQLLPSILKMPTSETKPVVRQALDLVFRAMLEDESHYSRLAEILSAAIYRESYSTVLVSVIWQSLTSLEGCEGLASQLLPLLCNSFMRSAQAVFMITESRLLPFELLGLISRLHVQLAPNLFDAISVLTMKLLLSMAMTDDPNNNLPKAIELYSTFDQTFTSSQQQQKALPWIGFDRIFSAANVSTADPSMASAAGSSSPEDTSQPQQMQQQQQLITNQKNALRLIKALLLVRIWVALPLDLVTLGPSLLILARNCPASITCDFFEILEPIFDYARNTSGSVMVTQFLESLYFTAQECILAGKNLPLALFVITKSPEVQSIEKIVGALIKHLPRLTRDYLSKQDNNVYANTASSNSSLAISDLESQVKLVIIPVMKVLIQSKADFIKSPLLLSIGQFWEKAMDPFLLKFLVDLFIGWIEVRPAGEEGPGLLSLKELSVILLTPNRLDQIKDASLLERYLDLVLTIYQNPSLLGSELTNRLEGSFLQGLANPVKRSQFVSLLDGNLSKSVSLRLQYLLGGIRWNLGGSFDWIPTAVHLLLQCVSDVQFSVRCKIVGHDTLSDPINEALARLTTAPESKKAFEYLEHFLYHDHQMALKIWYHLFPLIWAGLSDIDRDGVSKAMTKLLASQEKNISLSSINPVYSILAAASACVDSPPKLPPHLLRFMAQAHKTWYSSLCLLEARMQSEPGSGQRPDSAGRVAYLLYRDLSETDMMYGCLRRICSFPETSASLSFAEAKKWSLSQRIAESAQEATRLGTLPYDDLELWAWEEVWIESAKKLQQWDLITEVAKVDSDVDLNLEAIWRLGDWIQPETIGIAEGLLKSCSDPHKPRAKFIESFLVLNSIRENGNERAAGRFQSCLEEAIQGTLQSWNLLPDHVSRTHASVLHTFQMFVEIQEAMTIYTGISGGASNPASMINRPQFLTDLKGLLSTWRERLPNRMDDMNVWSDLLAWRQHIFSALNAAFQTPNPTAGGPVDPTGAPHPAQAHPFAYRGYHELAWLINKFSRVNRKNGLSEVCLSFLNRIYTLPNIEIQDAFSKLREQTLCYLDVPSDLPTALEVINATNLNYFSTIQKAEFFSLKALILSKLGMVEDANRVFAQAVQIDLNIGKGWSYWGNFNDQRFQQTHDITLAVSAINCYLQAATLFKIDKARKFGARILWLLTFEDAAGSMAKSFELYNNDLPTWFWVPFIPQLLSSLARKEARLVRFLLIKLAKSFPQALYLPLRTAGDEFRTQFGGQRIVINPPPATSTAAAPQQPKAPEAEDGSAAPMQEGSGSTEVPPQQSNTLPVEPKRSPVDYSDDLLAILKTGYPLLSLSMENMVEHIVQRLRSTADEDLFRVIVTLLSEAFQQMMIRFNSASEATTGNGMESSLKRVSYMLGSSPYLASTYKKAFDGDFEDENMPLDEVIALLQAWRTDLERVIRRCPASFSLESLSRFLAEFEYQRYDEVEVPGQYLLVPHLHDNNNDFVKIDRFEPIVEIVRRHGSSFRRINIRGTNGSHYKFVVQNPSARQSRREEKIMQFFRTIKRSLKQNPNSRRRGLDFVIPVIVSISAHVRLIQDDTDQVTLEEVYERYCASKNLDPEDVLIYYRDAFQSEIKRLGIQLRKGNVEVLNLRVDLFQQISQGLIPSDILSSYIRSISPSPDKYWLFRQTFARQYAGSVFLSYVMALGHRYPHKIAFSRLAGTVLNTEILPTLNPNGQITLVEAVPFRLTPNLQEFMTPTVVEGIFAPAIHSCSEVFFKPDSELCEFLPMIIRDELVSWVLLNQPARPRFVMDSEGNPIAFKHDLEILEQYNIDERQFLGRVIQNCELAMKRCQTLACIKEAEKATDGKTSAYQTIIDLVSCATNPQKLALMDAHWHPWF